MTVYVKQCQECGLEATRVFKSLQAAEVSAHKHDIFIHAGECKAKVDSQPVIEE